MNELNLFKIKFTDFEERFYFNGKWTTDIWRTKIKFREQINSIQIRKEYWI